LVLLQRTDDLCEVLHDGHPLLFLFLLLFSFGPKMKGAEATENRQEKSNEDEADAQ
jgi:hypothetical protein